MKHQLCALQAALCRTMRRVLVCCLFLTGSNSVLSAEVEIRSDSPNQYTVVQGDTLWDIAGKFLEEPWLWPQVWQINPQIENPDLIYPGDVIELVYNPDGTPVLRLSRTDVPELPTIRFSPHVRREAILSPIPAISLDSIASFLSPNSVIAEIEFEVAPYLLAESEGRSLISSGNTVFGRGDWNSAIKTYDIVRKGREFTDPDLKQPLRIDSGNIVIGIEAITVGTVELNSVNGDKGILTVLESYAEIKPGDRLIPRQGQVIESRYLPTPPDFNVDAAIVSIGVGKEIGGLYDSLILNQGLVDGIKPGQILTVKEPNQMVTDAHGKANAFEDVKQVFGVNSKYDLEFPGNDVATVLVYRVFNDTSMALVIRSKSAIRLNDRVLTPD